MELFDDKFPRQIAIPNRILCLTKKEFYKKFNQYNGKVAKIYYSVFKCDKDEHFEHTQVDKLPFDFYGSNSKTYGNMFKLYSFCKQKNIKSLFKFSTGGYWGFIFTKNYTELKNPKDALANAQKFIAKECGFKIYERNAKNEIDPELNDVDFHIIGDLARVCRAANSYDVKRGLFCIPLKESDILAGDSFIRDRAKKQQFEFELIGKEEMDMTQFDYIPEKFNVIIPEHSFDYQDAEKIGDLVIKEMYPCVKQWITGKDSATWKARYYATVWLKEKGFSIEFIEGLLKKFFEQYERTDRYKNNWHHYKKNKVAEAVFKKDTIFPACETLWQEGLCPGKCKYFSKMYYKNGTDTKT